MDQFAAFYVSLITETSAKSTHAASVSIFKLTTYCSYFFGEKKCSNTYILSNVIHFVLQKRRVADLLSNFIPEDEAALMKNGR